MFNLLQLIENHQFYFDECVVCGTHLIHIVIKLIWRTIEHLKLVLVNRVARLVFVAVAVPRKLVQPLVGLKHVNVRSCFNSSHIRAVIRFFVHYDRLVGIQTVTLICHNRCMNKFVHKFTAWPANKFWGLANFFFQSKTKINVSLPKFVLYNTVVKCYLQVFVVLCGVSPESYQFASQ